MPVAMIVWTRTRPTTASARSTVDATSATGALTDVSDDDDGHVLGPAGEPRQRPRRQSDGGGHQCRPAGPLQAGPVACASPAGSSRTSTADATAGHHEAQDRPAARPAPPGRRRRGRTPAPTDGKVATRDEGQAASGEPAIGEPDREVEQCGQRRGERERAPVTGACAVRGPIRQRRARLRRTRPPARRRWRAATPAGARRAGRHRQPTRRWRAATSQASPVPIDEPPTTASTAPASPSTAPTTAGRRPGPDPVSAGTAIGEVCTLGITVVITSLRSEDVGRATAAARSGRSHAASASATSTAVAGAATHAQAGTTVSTRAPVPSADPSPHDRPASSPSSDSRRPRPTADDDERLPATAPPAVWPGESPRARVTATSWRPSRRPVAERVGQSAQPEHGEERGEVPRRRRRSGAGCRSTDGIGVGDETVVDATQPGEGGVDVDAVARKADAESLRRDDRHRRSSLSSGQPAVIACETRPRSRSNPLPSSLVPALSTRPTTTNGDLACRHIR